MKNNRRSARAHLGPCILIISLSVAALVGTARAAEPENLIRDGGFEREFQTLLDVPDLWTIWGHDDGKIWTNFVRDTENPRSGKASLRIFRPGNKRGAWFSVLATPPDRHPIPPRKGKKYTVSFWARTDQPGEFLMQVASYKSVSPFIDGASPARLSYHADTEWKPFSVSFTEGLDFFLENAAHLYLAFFMATEPEDTTRDRRLWLDDISMVEEEADPDARGYLINPATMDYPRLPLRLEKGERIEVTVEPDTPLHPAGLLSGGISMM
ncbi:MAG: hypothetical protein U1E27_02640, partial [Kiritimatiellia bacterium]|nr:hypothetical protein [Kiritimatiellia bacterium]